jgi:uncharacterized membrane protein (GlpM family)
MRFLIKTVLSALIIAAISEVGKRSSTVAAILASLPLTSILAFIWLYADTGDAEQVAKLSTGIFWALIPSFLLLLSLPWLLRQGVRFPLALAISCAIMASGYAAYAWGLAKLGVEI